VPVHRLGTDRSMDEVLREVKDVIWQTL
jgi:hypothetical protein